MIDYYRLIRGTISALEANTEAQRHALYDRLRNSLARILRDDSGAPNEDNIMEECVALEAAITRVEAPYSFVDTLSNLPSETRNALRDALDTMHKAGNPLAPSALIARMRDGFGNRLTPCWGERGAKWSLDA